MVNQVAVRKDAIPGWFQATFPEFEGECLIGVDATVAVFVPQDGDAVSDIAAPNDVLVVTDGPATADPHVSIFQFPRIRGSASISFEGDVPALDVHPTAAIAYARVDGRGMDTIIQDVLMPAGVLIFSRPRVSVPQTGEAVVSMAYFGDGNVPIFGFKLPARFTNNPFNVQDAGVDLPIDAPGFMDGAGGFGDAVVPELVGGAELLIQGMTPVLPFRFPIVFDDIPVNVNLGNAVVRFSMASDAAIEVVGESAVAVVAGGSHLRSAVFPWSFPVAVMDAA